MSNLLAVLDSIKSSVPTEEENEQIPEDKLSKTYELWIKKVPIANIARGFGVAESTIYRWIDKYKENFDFKLVNKPRSELLLDMIRFTRVVRDVAMNQVHDIDLTAVKVMPDGSMVRNTENMDLKAKGTFLKLALDAEAKSFDMLQKTGVLPSAIKEIYYSLQETRPVDKAVSDTPTRTKDEMINHITELISGGRTIPRLIDMEDIIVTGEVAM